MAQQPDGKVKELIEIKDLSFRYSDDGKEILQHIDLSIRRGEFIAVVGRNGSGKSTLARHLNGLLIPTSGDVIIDGLNTKDDQSLWSIRQTAGLVFQNPDNQIVAAVVEDDVAFGPENLGVLPALIRKRVDWALQTVGMYEDRFKAPHLLSGGQKQRVAIAGVLAMKPKCIILDEPTAMLDPVGRSEVIETVRNINQNDGITVILITHNMEEAVLADRVIVMEHGKIAAIGTPVEIFRDKDLLSDCGLEAPDTVMLMSELRNAGIPVSDPGLSADECVTAILDAYQGMDER